MNRYIIQHEAGGWFWRARVRHVAWLVLVWLELVLAAGCRTIRDRRGSGARRPQ
jgi:hypothetical protein